MSGAFTPLGAEFALDYLSGSMSTTLVVGASSRSVYIMLLTATPTNLSEMSTYVEVSATGYARQAVTWGAATLNSAGVYQISNTNSLLFGPFTAVGGLGPQATMCALVTVETGVGGQPLMLWTLDTPGSAPQNASLEIAAGTLTMSLA
jgi:hypothetical protein